MKEKLLDIGDIGSFAGLPAKICYYYVNKIRTKSKIIENREDLRYIFCAAVDLQRQRTILASSCIISRAVNVINYSGADKAAVVFARAARITVTKTTLLYAGLPLSLAKSARRVSNTGPIETSHSRRNFIIHPHSSRCL